MKLSQVLMTGSLMLLGMKAHGATTVCNTVAECQELNADVNARLQELQSGQIPKFFDAARDEYGNVRLMSHYSAVQHCKSQGAHLPTVRELARYAMSLGAKGIAEVADGKPADNSSYLIEVRNADGQLDHFYFSSVGFQRPIGALESDWFWSSSVNLANSDNAFFLNGVYGVVGSVDRFSHREPVRCVSGR